MTLSLTTKTLNNGLKIPIIGLGVYKSAPEECYATSLLALKQGYRHIDSAAFYKNEKEVGKAVRDSGIPRSEIFVTTKLFLTDADTDVTDAVTKQFQQSFDNLGIDYIDLYLMHAPFVGKRLEAWKVMESFVKDGRVKSIGISNFGIHHVGIYI